MTRSLLSRVVRCLCAAALLGAVTAAVPADANPAPQAPAAGTPSTAGPRPADTGRSLLADQPSYYPRMIRLEHSGAADGRIIANVATDTAAGAEGAVFESRDEGASFQHVGEIADPWGAAPHGGCCESLFELPRPVGALPAGTLLWSGSLGAGAGESRIRIWESADVGRTWTHLSDCYAAPAGKGLWEPWLYLDADDQLVCAFSDENEPDHSQVLAQTRSADGVHWSGKVDTVAAADPALRPGMSIVVRTGPARWAMTYEVCATGGAQDCEAHLRYSADGWHWGVPTDLGNRILATNGDYFAHTPTLVRIDTGPLRDALLVTGQVLHRADGSIAPGNGATVFVNRAGGRGRWRELPAPVAVPDAQNAVCPNYSPTLLPVHGGRNLLEISTDPGPTGSCRAYFGTGPLT